MASLTETAYYARRSINWLILGIIAYIIFRIIWSLFVSFLIFIFPPKAPPPDHKFGKLPQIKFPTVASPSAQLTFKLETIEGSVPNASGSAVVYFMPKLAPNLLALTNTQKFAERLNFNTNPKPENKNIYHFDDPDLPLRTLRYDIVSNNFIVKYNYAQDLGLFNANNTPQIEAAKQEAKTMLQTYGIMPDDFRLANISATYLKLSNDQLIPTTSQSQANAVRIDFFRYPALGMQMMTADPTIGLISITLSGTTISKKRVLEFAYTYWPIDYKTIATYKIKTSTQAWQELQKGYGYIPKYPAGNTIIVRQMKLAYFDSYEPQMYLQPIFVFEGDDFLGYVPAIAPPWTE
jgi:hypothetical protein